jgi:Xaa-Pro aminopeptidase
MQLWPSSSPASCFVDRRQRLLERFQGPVAFASGLPRVRNFEANHYAFRAESHFLYFVGSSIAEAVLYFEGGRVQLFVEPPLPDDRLWHGPQPSLAELSAQLQLEVRPLDEFAPAEETATLAPADVDSGLWLEDLLDRVLEPDADDAHPELLQADSALAQAMIDLRLRHDAFAILQMRQAVSVTCQAHLAGMACTRADQREASVRAVIEAEMAKAGTSPAYGSIVTVAGNVLHHKSSTEWMRSGDLLLVDAGAEVPEGWAADVTRTWPVSGMFDSFQAEVYDAVLAAQLAAIQMLRPGVRYRDVHRLAAHKLTEGLVEIGLLRGNPEELLERGVCAAFFPHGVGHLLGLDVHDMEGLGDRAGYAPGRARSTRPAERFLRLDRDMAPGMVVTIEPGFYNLEGLLDDPATLESVREAINPERRADLARLRGIRIEDDVLITEQGCEVLSAAIPKTRAEIETHMAASRD